MNSKGFGKQIKQKTKYFLQRFLRSQPQILKPKKESRRFLRRPIDHYIMILCYLLYSVFEEHLPPFRPLLKFILNLPALIIGQRKYKATRYSVKGVSHATQHLIGDCLQTFLER